jgi:hypothetical protein
MADTPETLASELRQRADRLTEDARRELAAAEQALKRHAHGDDATRVRMVQARETVAALGERIESMRRRISEERKPIRATLSAAENAALQAQAHCDQLVRQIQDKEREIEQLAGRRARRRVALGELIVTDPEATSRANALRTEVAGLYGALATAKGVVADAYHALSTLRTEAEETPIEADPRVAELYRSLELETAALASIRQPRGAQAAPAPLFTEAEKARMLGVVRGRVALAVPEDVQEDILRDAVERVEAALVHQLPVSSAGLLRRKQGLAGDAKGLASRLGEAVGKSLELPLLDPKQKAALVQSIVELVADGLRDGSTLDAALTRAEHARPPRSASKAKEK